MEIWSWLTLTFLISDESAACGTQLAIPAFTRGKSQLRPKEIETSQQSTYSTYNCWTVL